MTTLEIDLPRKARDTLLPTHTAAGVRVRFRCLYGGRDGAKSHSIARVLLARGMAKVERILCVREVQKSIADSVHKLLSDLIVSLDIGSFYSVQNTAIYGANGTEFSFHGLSTETRDSLKSKEGTTICWVEEAHSISKRSWDILEPTIRAEGSEIFVSFNPNLDSDEAYVRFVLKTQSDALVTNINWNDNPWRSKVLDAARERMEKESPEDFKHIYGGSPRTTVEGAIFRPEIEDLYKEPRRVRNVPYDPMLKVHTVWDLGWNDATAVLFVQRLHSEIRIFNYWEGSFRKISDWVADLKELRYNWGIDWLPHDGANTRIEVGQSVQKIMQQLGRNAQIVPVMPVEQSIKLARMVFPRCYFDEANTAELLNRLKRYRRRLNQMTQTFEAPLHDDASHGSDGFRYMCQKVEEMTNDDWRAMKPLNYPSLGTA